MPEVDPLRAELQHPAKRTVDQSGGFHPDVDDDLGPVPGREHELLEYDRTSQIAAVGGDLGHIGPLDAEVVNPGLAAIQQPKPNQPFRHLDERVDRAVHRQRGI